MKDKLLDIIEVLIHAMEAVARAIIILAVMYIWGEQTVPSLEVRIGILAVGVVYILKPYIQYTLSIRSKRESGGKEDGIEPR